jgi:sigma-B regulation protein RsbU (phosphoserine phosphatase)
MVQEQLQILLIEHDPGFARCVGDMLGRSGNLSSAQMQLVPDLSAGLAALRGSRFDAVLLDMEVPDGAGVANVSLIRAEAPELPIIAAGDADDERVALEAVQAGAEDYLVKGQINPGWLERSLRHAIERHRMDMALLAAEEKYHTVFDHLIEGVFQTTPDGRYLMANAALARIYGYSSPEELVEGLTDIGRRLYVQEGRRAEFIRLMRENDTITGFESQVFRKDGSVIWISENCRAVRDKLGNVLYYEGTVEDTTQRREAEEAARHAYALLDQSREALQTKNLEMEEDLKMARQVQMAMLPQQYPVFHRNGPLSPNPFHFTHRYLPTGSVGGDFFTVSALSDSEVGVLICDVAGHSVRSALVTAMIRALVEELKPLAGHPGQFLTKLNSDLHEILKHAEACLLTTAFYFVADWRTGSLCYANAGHPKPLQLCRTAGKVLPLANASGKCQPPLGLVENISYHSSNATLVPGDAVFLFTDGLIEIEDVNGKLYPPASLVSSIQKRLALPAEPLFDELLEEIRAYAAQSVFTDDVCLLAMDFA